jgi:DNA-binding HxlR family transcriptional regulator
VNTSLTVDRDEEDELLDEAAYVLASKYRQAIVVALREGPTTPSEIADRNDVHISHVSRGLRELRDDEIVRAHSSKSRTKLYTLTEYGQQVATLLEKRDQG